MLLVAVAVPVALSVPVAVAVPVALAVPDGAPGAEFVWPGPPLTLTGDGNRLGSVLAGGGNGLGGVLAAVE